MLSIGDRLPADARSPQGGVSEQAFAGTNKDESGFWCDRDATHSL